VVGWLANWPDVRDPAHSADFPSSMTLPRVLRRNGNSILVGPHPNVQKLRGDPLDGKALFRGNIIPLPNGTAYIQLGLNYNYFYNGIFLRLNHPDYLQLGVRVTNIGMEIVKVKR
jgi:beta-fructofuranosidase